MMMRVNGWLLLNAVTVGSPSNVCYFDEVGLLDARCGGYQLPNDLCSFRFLLGLSGCTAGKEEKRKGSAGC